MKKFKLAMVKEYRETGDEDKDNYLKHGQNFVGIKFFSSPNFHRLSDEAKEIVVKNILSQTPRSELSSKFEFEKKERLIVNETGAYGLDKTLYDKKVKLPSHLVDTTDSKKVIDLD